MTSGFLGVSAILYVCNSGSVTGFWFCFLFLVRWFFWVGGSFFVWVCLVGFKLGGFSESIEGEVGGFVGVFFIVTVLWCLSHK